jgi:hypothetical protein
LAAFARLACGDYPGVRATVDALGDEGERIEAKSVRAWIAACRTFLDIATGEALGPALGAVEASLADPLAAADRDPVSWRRRGRAPRRGRQRGRDVWPLDAVSGSEASSSMS